VAGQRAREEPPALSGGPSSPMQLAGGRHVSRCPAGAARRLAPLESTSGAASARARSRHGRWADPGGAVGGGAPRVFPAGPGGDGRLAGEEGRREPAALGAWRVRAARGDATAAVAQAPAPPRPPDENAVARGHQGALSPRGGRRDVSGAVPTGWAQQKRAPGGLGWGARHLPLSWAP